MVGSGGECCPRAANPDTECLHPTVYDVMSIVTLGRGLAAAGSSTMARALAATDELRLLLAGEE